MPLDIKVSSDVHSCLTGQSQDRDVGHKIDSLFETDFIMAARMDHIYEPYISDSDSHQRAVVRIAILFIYGPTDGAQLAYPHEDCFGE